MNTIEDKIRSELSAPQVASMATIAAAGVPWTRYMVITTDENMIIRSPCMYNSRKIEHIENNKQVHLCCGASSTMRIKPYLQIQAVAAVSTEKRERHALWSPNLKSIFEGPDDPEYAVLIMLPYKIEYWTAIDAEPTIWRVRDQAEIQNFLAEKHPIQLNDQISYHF